MKAMMLTGIRKMEMMDIPEPVIVKPNDVRIRMSVVGICGSDILLMRSQNKKAVVLAPIFQHSAQVLVVSAHSGIEHLQDLTGKRIALEPEAVELLASLKGEGVSLKNCIVKPPSFDINQLISDQVDALSAYSTDELFGLKKANFDFIWSNFSVRFSIYLQFYLSKI